ncbi:MAG: DUF5687 family protein [Pedobacter sp.]|uniref:DUF5687 family protein n=1 Tax=Pedobacter sp. TaxID=1411316 RepID=UPI0028076F5E|nr:DUF5687 family protein [Pedobacter sp.]MDQ8003803.1 DUF5687 family protein [Pedobacter sp.]
MLSTFLSHQWKSFWRSRNKAGSIAAQIVLGFFMLYFLVVAIGIGFWMTTLIDKFMPGINPAVVFNGLILYYFLLDLAVRIQMQDLPTLSVVPYLHLKISRKTIVNFLNLKSLVSFFNILPIFIFFPFIFINISASAGTVGVLAYLVSIIGLTVFNNFLVLYIKRKAINNVAVFAAGIVVILGLAASDYYGFISIRDFSNLVFQNVAVYPILALIFPVAAFAVYYMNAKFLESNLYTEELSTKDDKKVSTDYPFLNNFGKAGELAALELKLILRHKRSRSSVIMGFLFLCYGFFFYRMPLIAGNEFGKMLFAAVFMTGITISVYGQFMYAWQSSHFDGLLSNKINYKDFIKAKFLLFTISSTLITVLSSFYGFMSYKLLILHAAAYIYNLGVGTVVVLYFANFNYKRLDITASASFNWQGVGATQWLLGLPLLLLPMIIYVPFGILNLPYWGLATIAFLGLVGLLMRNFWVDVIVRKFEKQRYKIAEGFRE